MIPVKRYANNGLSDAAILLRPGSARTPKNWMRVKETGGGLMSTSSCIFSCSTVDLYPHAYLHCSFQNCRHKCDSKLEDMYFSAV